MPALKNNKATGHEGIVAEVIKWERRQGDGQHETRHRPELEDEENTGRVEECDTQKRGQRVVNYCRGIYNRGNND